MASSDNIRWYHSLQFQSILVFGSIVGWLVFAIAIAVHTIGRQTVSVQVKQSLEQAGNNTVAQLSVRLHEIAALTRTLAATAHNLPPDPQLYQQTIPGLLDFSGDLAVAGGGVWPEPFQFDATKARASFFWGRSPNGTLVYYDDYNQPGPGYHHEAWYVTAHHLKPGVCSWSESYMDPYSLEPMVTCTVGVFKQNKLTGAATVDLKLGGLKQWAANWQTRSEGYLFVMDRNNRFITFPEPKRVLQTKPDKTGNSTTTDYGLAHDLAKTDPHFAPLDRALTQINQTILAKARQRPNYDPALAQNLNRASYQIDPEGAELLAATLLDPLDQTLPQSYLLAEVPLPHDPLLQAPATAFIFHVPQAYWKLVIVKPNTAIVAPANEVMNGLLLSVLVATLIAAPVGYWVLKRWLLNPVAHTTNEVNTMAQAIAAHHWDAIPHLTAANTERNEIGLLRRVFYTLARTTADKSQQLQATNLELRKSLHQLTTTQSQLVQAEKMSSLGQLVAGIAHEINNPVNFIYGNLSHAQTYTEELLALAEQVEAGASTETLKTLLEDMELAFLKEDVPRLLASMATGTHRIREIVLSLRNFSRLDESAYKAVDIHEGLNSTLTILSHRIKASANRPSVQIIQQYGDLPLVECYPGPLNQVFMNLLSNALDALEDREQQHRDRTIAAQPSRIEIQTEVVAGDRIRIHIRDNGPGMTAAVQQRVFDYMFTTKAPGKGTGLGLTISRDIVEGKHQGHLSVVSIPGQETTFTIELPISLRQPKPPVDASNTKVPALSTRFAQ